MKKIEIMLPDDCSSIVINATIIASNVNTYTIGIDMSKSDFSSVDVENGKKEQTISI